MKTTIYFVRHGNVYNPTHVLYERLPHFHLTKEGREQAAEAANILKEKNIDILFSSPLLRTRQTAKIIQKKLNLPSIFYSQLLIEVKSRLAGKPQLSSDEMNYLLYVSKDRKPGIDESLEDIKKRFFSFVEKMVTQHNGKNIVAVTHADPIMVLYTVIKNHPLDITLFDDYTFIKTGGIMRIIEEDGKLSADFL